MYNSLIDRFFSGQHSLADVELKYVYFFMHVSAKVDCVLQFENIHNHYLGG